MDYYSILGVPKNADDKTIRKAYKTQSMKHHPDRGGDEEQFKKINEAYSTLKDPQKRQQYDNPQPQFNFNSRDFRGQNPFEDIFGDIFSGQQHRRARPRNSDIRLKVKIEFEEVLIGKKIIAAYMLRNGKEETVNLDIPPGAKDGDTVKFSQLGDNSLPGQRGDLYVIIQVKNKIGWSRNHNDLSTTVKVNCLEMIIGSKILVNTLDNKRLELNIPAETKNGTTFSVNNYGIPDMRTGQRGKLFIRVEASIPNNLSEEQINKIKEVINEIN